MFPLAIAILLALGAGGTVVASDSARPGDFLYPVDRAAESVRAALTSEEGQAELKVKFAEERLDEIESLIEDESESGDDSGADAATSTPEFSEEARANLQHALDTLTLHLADIQGRASTTPGIAQAISVIQSRLAGDIDSLPQELRAKIRDDRGRVELRTEDGKIRIEFKSDGELRVKLESEQEDEGDDDGEKKEKKEESRSSSSGSGGANSGSSTFKAEIRIGEDSRGKIEIEEEDEKDEVEKEDEDDDKVEEEDKSGKDDDEEDDDDKDEDRDEDRSGSSDDDKDDN